MTLSRSFFFALALLLRISDVWASCSHESFFEVDVDIDPKKADFDFTRCDTKSAKEKLQKLIQKVVAKRFDAYFESRTSLLAAEVDNFCGGKTDRRRGRELVITMSQNGFSYFSTSKCRFCLPADSDGVTINPPAMPREEKKVATINGTVVQLSVSPSSAPSMAPTTSTSAPSWPPPLQMEETLLQEHLQHQLTRVLTKKINKNSKRSCLAGSQSEVTVTLTPTGSQPPSIVCPID